MSAELRAQTGVESLSFESSLGFASVLFDHNVQGTCADHGANKWTLCSLSTKSCRQAVPRTQATTNHQDMNMMYLAFSPDLLAALPVLVLSQLWQSQSQNRARSDFTLRVPSPPRSFREVASGPFSLRRSSSALSPSELFFMGEVQTSDHPNRRPAQE